MSVWRRVSTTVVISAGMQFTVSYINRHLLDISIARFLALYYFGYGQNYIKSIKNVQPLCALLVSWFQVGISP